MKELVRSDQFGTNFGLLNYVQHEFIREKGSQRVSGDKRGNGLWIDRPRRTNFSRPKLVPDRFWQPKLVLQVRRPEYGHEVSATRVVLARGARSCVLIPLFSLTSFLPFPLFTTLVMQVIDSIDVKISIVDEMKLRQKHEVPSRKQASGYVTSYCQNPAH